MWCLQCQVEKKMSIKLPLLSMWGTYPVSVKLSTSKLCKKGIWLLHSSLNLCSSVNMTQSMTTNKNNVSLAELPWKNKGLIRDQIGLRRHPENKQVWSWAGMLTSFVSNRHTALPWMRFIQTHSLSRKLVIKFLLCVCVCGSTMM